MSSNSTHGPCARCGDSNPYSAIICSGCNSRLPWVDAVSTARKSAPTSPAKPVSSQPAVAPQGPLLPTPPRPAQTRTASQRRSWVAPFLGVMLILLLTAGFLVWRWMRSPTYSLLMAKRAVDTRDLGTFEKYVDVEGCVDSFVDDMIAQVNKQTRPTALPPFSGAEAGEALAKAMIVALKPMIGAGLKKGIRDAVEKGDSEKKHDPQTEALKKKAREEEITYGGIEYVKETGGTATVGLSIISKKDKAKSFTLELKMQWFDGYWRVIQWSNVIDVMKKLGLENFDDMASGGGALPGIPGAPSLFSPNPTAPEMAAPTPATGTQRSAIDEAGYREFVTNEMKVHTDGLNAIADTMKSGNPTTLCDAASRLRSSALESIQKLDTLSPPPRFATANGLIRQALDRQSEGADEIATSAEEMIARGEKFSGSDTQPQLMQSGMRKLEESGDLIKQASDHMR